MTEGTKTDGALDAPQLSSLEMQQFEQQFEEERASRAIQEGLHRQHNRRYLIFASLEVAGIWAVAIALLFLKA